MFINSTFNPILQPSGSFIANNLQSGGTMVVINKSYVDIQFNFFNGQNPVVLANDREKYFFPEINGTPVFSWTQKNIDYTQTVLQLQNIVYVVVYLPGEDINLSFPSPISREPVPNIYPYNTGTGYASVVSVTPSANNLAIFPSSYIGVSAAPRSIGGSGFDHFYSFLVPTAGSNMADIPGLYAGTGKTSVNAVPSGTGTNLTVPGPFSISGLPATDTGNNLTNSYYTVAFFVDMLANVANGFYIDAWVSIPKNPDHNMMIYADDYPPVNNKGIAFYIDVNGMVQGWAGWTGGAAIVESIGAITLHDVHHLAFEYTGTNNGNQLQLWIDGKLQGSFTPVGNPVNSATNGNIGRNPILLDTGFTGTINNIGICLSDPTFLTFPGSIPAPQGALFRYLLGIQSTQVDIQTAWINGFIFTCMADVSTSARTMQFNQAFNPGGLLRTNVYAKHIIPHYLDTFTKPLTFYYTTSASFTVIQTVTFPEKIGQFSSGNFITFQNTAGPSYSLAVFGSNILGIA